MPGLASLKREIAAVYWAYRDPETPLLPKLILVIALGYALSPVDLIPDLLPAIGLADDAAVLTLAFKLVHDDVVEFKDWREKNQSKESGSGI